MTVNILCFGGHADDLELAMGGTIAKYSSEGKNVISVVLSNGEGSSPWLRTDLLIEERIRETKEVSKYLGSKTILLGLADGHLEDEILKQNVQKKISSLIVKYKPKQIFVPSHLDPHPDHRAVNKVVSMVLNKIDKKKKISTYSYEVWNVINEHRPRLYIDISRQFKKKIKALKMFESQTHFIYPLLIPVYYRALVSGLHNGCRYAERFHKIR